MRTTITRWHEFDAGHRVWLHESVCRRLHGHRYRAEITLTAPSLDNIGRVVDFGVVKAVLCKWLDDHWDHRLLLWKEDPLVAHLAGAAPEMGDVGLCVVPFNPTAENMARYLLLKFNGLLDSPTYGDLSVTGVTIHETLKCSAAVTADAP